MINCAADPPSLWMMSGDQGGRSRPSRIASLLRVVSLRLACCISTHIATYLGVSVPIILRPLPTHLSSTPGRSTGVQIRYCWATSVTYSQACSTINLMHLSALAAHSPFEARRHGFPVEYGGLRPPLSVTAYKRKADVP